MIINTSNINIILSRMDRDRSSKHSKRHGRIKTGKKTKKKKRTRDIAPQVSCISFLCHSSNIFFLNYFLFYNYKVTALRPIVEYSDVSSEDLSAPEAGEIQSEESPFSEQSYSRHAMLERHRILPDYIDALSIKRIRKRSPVSVSSHSRIYSPIDPQELTITRKHLRLTPTSPLIYEDEEERKHRKKKEKKHKRDKKGKKKKKRDRTKDSNSELSDIESLERYKFYMIQ